MKKRILILCMILIFAGGIFPASTVPSLQAAETQTAPYLARPSKSGALKVRGGKLCDKKGRPVQLKGVSTHGLAWFPQYVNQKCFNQLSQKWGINCVRLALYTEEYGGYCSGGSRSNLKKLVKQGVEYAKKADMYVIIDWHILSDGNPNTHRRSAKAFFTYMSRTFSKYNNVLYEICNEPNGGTTWTSIKKYANYVIPAIKENDPDAVIIIGTPTWSQELDKAVAHPVKGYSNIMYSLHFYAGTHKLELRNTLRAALKRKLPVFVTEFGICDASGNGALNKIEANRWIRTMNKYGVSYICWNLSNKNESSALIKSSCRKTYGFTRSDLSASGRWFVDMMKK